MAKPKILVADNSPNFLESFAEYLSRSGRHQVLTAVNPESAEEELEKNLIHLALVDVRLRNDRDENDRSGLCLCERMDPTVARILLTEHTSDPESWQLVRDASRPTDNRHRLADGFFSKMENMQFIKNEIQRMLDEEFEILPERRIAVLTSGGDAPGMNAAIWAIVRTAMNNDIEVMGVQDGYKGLVNDRMRKLKWDEVSDIVEHSGTILGAARFPEFRRQSVRQQAIDNIKRKHISGLIVIGGDGSMQGAQALATDLPTFQTVAIPGTIDNDLWGTDMSLGTASAANAMIEEMRNMIQPARALRRIFVCEVMGASCGYLALQAALGIGADAVIIPEQVIEVRHTQETESAQSWRHQVDINKTERTCLAHLESVAELLSAIFAANKRYGFVVVAEGIKLLTRDQRTIGAKYVEQYLTSAIRDWSLTNKPDVRVQELGYTVRGVQPVQFDVQLGARLGAEAVLCMLQRETEVMIGWTEEKGIIKLPFAEVVAETNRPPRRILDDRPKWKEALELQQALACPPKLREQLATQGNRFVQ